LAAAFPTAWRSTAAAHAWGWWSNGSGELGNGSPTSSDTRTPVAVSTPAGVAFSALAAGGFYSVALDGGGHAWAWGSNDGGELGNGSTAYSTTPVAVSMPPGVAFSAVAPGGAHSPALQVSADAAISANGTTFNATEGTTFKGTVASFSDPDSSASASEYQATIDWGDGTPTSSGTVGGGGGSFSVTGGPHTYAEEGTYKATVTITDTDNTTNSATASMTATVADAALTSTCAAPTTSPQSFTTPMANFHDANPGGTLSDYGATIDWCENHRPAFEPTWA
jgi:hypothetical protein